MRRAVHWHVQQREDLCAKLVGAAAGGFGALLARGGWHGHGCADRLSAHLENQIYHLRHSDGTFAAVEEIFEWGMNSQRLQMFWCNVQFCHLNLDTTLPWLHKGLHKKTWKSNSRFWTTKPDMLTGVVGDAALSRCATCA